MRHACVVLATAVLIGGCATTVSDAPAPSSPSEAVTTTSTAATPTASTAATATTTTATTGPSSTAEFAQFLQRSLAGTSYSIDSLTSSYGETQVDVHMYFAESICAELEAGKSESALRRVRASEEAMGDPSLDKDIPVYVDAIFSAAKTYVCP